MCRDVRFFMPCRPVRGRNTPSRPPLRPCSGIRFLPPGSFVRALACRRLRFSLTSQPLSSSPFVPALTPPLASEPLSPGCPCCRDVRFAAPGAACRSVHDDRREIFAEKRRGTFRLFRGVLLYACEPVLFAHRFVFVKRRACDRAVSLPALPVCSRPAVRPARGCRPRRQLKPGTNT